MAQKKLIRFAAIKTFANVLEYPEGMGGQWRSFFKNDNPVVLELACGRGEYTVGLSRLHPHHNHIGVDIKGNRMYIGAKQALAEGLNNAAFLRTQIEKINPMISLAFIVFGLVKVVTQTYGEDNNIWEGFLNWGLPSALIVAGAAFLEPSFKKFAPALLLRLGDGSYSLYLFHPFIVPGFAALLSKFGLQSPLIAIITLLSLSVVICQLIYVKIEKPITVYLSQKTS